MYPCSIGRFPLGLKSSCRLKARKPSFGGGLGRASWRRARPLTCHSRTPDCAEAAHASRSGGAGDGAVSSQRPGATFNQLSRRREAIGEVHNMVVLVVLFCPHRSLAPFSAGCRDAQRHGDDPRQRGESIGSAVHLFLRHAHQVHLACKTRPGRSGLPRPSGAWMGGSRVERAGAAVMWAEGSDSPMRTGSVTTHLDTLA